jgi:hypothetical protein
MTPTNPLKNKEYALKALTKQQIIDNLKEALSLEQVAAYNRGRAKAQEEMAAQFASAKLAQLQAAAKLMEEAGRIMSRAGYMIGKINGDNNR